MSMRTQLPAEHTSRMISPDLHFRTSITMWGPLQLTFTNHREGAELGYAAGQAAYSKEGHSTLEDAMHLYLQVPKYRPRSCTTTIIAEWQAMFLLGWTSRLFEQLTSTSPETDEQAQLQRLNEARRPTPTTKGTLTRGRGQR